MSDIEEYTLHPFVPWALGMFRDGNDGDRPDKYVDGLAERVLNHLDELDDRERGQVIIDLLTLCDSMGQAITLMSLREIERGQEQ